jgi:hypothetical protein
LCWRDEGRYHKDQIDAGESRGALLLFDAANGEAQTAAAMDRTSGLLADPDRVRAAVGLYTFNFR